MLLLVGSTVENFGKKQIFSVPIILQSCVLYLALIVGLVSLLIIRYRNPISVLGLRWTRWRREIPLAILALLSIYPLIILVQLIVQAIVEKYTPGVTAPQEIVQFLADSPGLQERLLLAFLAIVMAPLAEETIFRGFMFGTMRQFWGRWPAIIISSVVFALIHSHIPALPGLFILAVFLTLVYERTGSLWAPIMLHAIFNTVTIVGTIFFPSSMP